MTVVRPWSQQVAWTHSWDAVDAVLYTPAGVEADYGVDTSLRVASIPDRAGSMPLARDAGPYGETYLLPSPVPGPLWIPADPRLYGSRPAIRFDILPSHSGDEKFYAMLTPNAAGWFNPPNGYAAPYWIAILGDGQDSALGEIGAGPTFSKGTVLGGTDWTVACYDFGSTITYIRSPHNVNPAESVLLLYYNSGHGAASADSFLEVNYRKANGALDSVRTYGGQEPWPFKELFYGWVDPHGYWSAAGIKLGVPTEAQLSAVRQWAGPYLPVAGSRP